MHLYWIWFYWNSFDLDSKSLEDKRTSNFSDKKAPEHSSKHEKNQDSGDNNTTSSNISRGLKFTQLSCLIIMVTGIHSEGSPNI